MLLPAVNARERLREIGFALLLAERRAIAPDELAGASGFDDVTGLLDQLAETGWIDRDRDGQLTGSAGLSLTEGPHRLRLGETTFRTWCASTPSGSRRRSVVTPSSRRRAAPVASASSSQ